MSLYRACMDAFFHIGTLIRDLDRRLKEVEIRSAMNYPQIGSGSALGSAVEDYNIHRPDGTLAVEIKQSVSSHVVPPWGVQTGNNYGQVYAKTNITFYNKTGTVVRTITLTPSTGATGMNWIDNLTAAQVDYF